MSHTQRKAESVSKNPFFQVLRQTYGELYSLAAARGWKICVPHSTSISGATLNEYFFKSHILQSSPYFKEEFVTLNGQCVIYKDGMISTKTGFASPRKVYVLGEELFYTKEFKSFVVYSINSPLVGISNHHITSKTKMNNNLEETQVDAMQKYKRNERDAILQVAIENRKSRDWKQLLSLYLHPVIYKQMMDEMRKFSQQFNRSYVMIKGYTKSASTRVQEFRNKTFEELVINNYKYNYHKRKMNNYKYNERELDELKYSFDCYLNLILFDRIFNTFLIRHFNAEDRVFKNKLSRLQSLSQHHIGIQPQFQCASNFKLAVQQLTRINDIDYKSPIHKLGVLQKTFTLIRQCIDDNNNHNINYNKEAMALTTDDMLSLFTYVLIHSNPSHILSNNEYIKHFYFPLHCSAHLDYFVATLQASIQYIKNQLFAQCAQKNSDNLL